MRTEIVRDWAALTRLGGEWNALLSRSRADTIFLRWEWIQAWGEVQGRSMPLVVVVARDAQGVLTGVAPFYRTTLRLLGRVPFRTLRVLGDYPTGSEYPDWIVRVQGEDETVAILARGLLAERREWDCIWMHNVSGWTGALERLGRACAVGRLHRLERPAEFALVTLPGSYDDYVRSLSQNKRQQLRQEMRRILGRPGVAVVQCSRADEVPRFLDALFELHSRRWAQVGSLGSFRRKPEEAEFYRRFVPLALERGWLRLFGLEERGELKAVQIGYVYGDVFHQMQEGFDPEYPKGAGNVLRAQVIEQCIAEGLKAIDFLGEMTEHKRRWQAKVRLGHDVFLGRRGLKTRLLFSAGLWPTGRFLRPEAPRGAAE